MKPNHKSPLLTGLALVILGPCIGIAGTIFGMVGAFGEMGRSEAADPAQLSAEISKTLYSTVAGLIVGFVGLVFIIVGAVRWHSNRRIRNED